ncbi:MAG: PAS domain S-box protein, partial [Syntrophales bacterium]|nr:PAS domain S-box protein [Syntrophales bacterium]
DMQKQTPEEIASQEKLLLDGVITERKRVEETLRESEDRHRRLIELLPDGIVVHSEGRVVFANPASARIIGALDPAELIGKPVIEFVHPEYRELALKRIKQSIDEGIQAPLAEEKLIRLDGRPIDVEVTAIPFCSADKPAMLTVFNDISERKRTEEALRESTEYLRNLITYAGVPIVVWNPDLSITEFNQAFERLSGFSREEVLGQPLDILFPAESRDASLEHIKKTTGGERWDAVYIPVAAKDGAVRLVLWNSANIPDRWGRLAVTIAQGIDVTEHRQAEQRVAETLNRLRGALGGIIQVVSATVETRDPYTAGHQKRVANLARAIAQEMGLSEDQVEGLRTACVIHDLGKVSIPAEILSKPTKLSEIEYKLIQAHSQRGHDILRGIDFPWPVAEMVLQHHERMNGSGYPRGLKGEAILIEARILAVADVLEAMASHRPYRLTLGMDAALEEIEKNRGILYDPAAADSCLKLIREKGFRLDQNACPAEDKILSDGP